MHVSALSQSVAGLSLCRTAFESLPLVPSSLLLPQQGLSFQLNHYNDLLSSPLVFVLRCCPVTGAVHSHDLQDAYIQNCQRTALIKRKYPWY